jgi:hypothetical protein
MEKQQGTKVPARRCFVGFCKKITKLQALVGVYRTADGPKTREAARGIVQEESGNVGCG